MSQAGFINLQGYLINATLRSILTPTSGSDSLSLYLRTQGSLTWNQVETWAPQQDLGSMVQFLFINGWYGVKGTLFEQAGWGEIVSEILCYSSRACEP